MHVHEAWIPIIMFLSMAVVLTFLLWFRFRSRQEMQQTIRAAIDRGQELTPELVEKIGRPPRPRYRDLRWGLVSIGIAVGCIIFGTAIGRFEDEAAYVFAGLAGFPASIGVAFVVMHFLGGRDA